MCKVEDRGKIARGGNWELRAGVMGRIPGHDVMDFCDDQGARQINAP